MYTDEFKEACEDAADESNAVYAAIGKLLSKLEDDESLMEHLQKKLKESDWSYTKEGVQSKIENAQVLFETITCVFGEVSDE